MSSFEEKQLRATLILAKANTKFPGTNSNTLVLTDMRMSAHVEATANLATNLQLSIFGMTQEQMNALTVAWAIQPVILDNIVILESNDGRGWSTVFQGTIIESQPEYRAAPNVYFTVQASVGYSSKINIAEPSSFPGEASIKTIAETIINKMGFKFIDGGAKGVLTNQYLKGTLWDQLAAACTAAKANFYFQGDRVLVTPLLLPNQSALPSVRLNPQSGLIGYPVYDRAGLNVTCLYDPAIACGLPVDIVSAVPNATGRWYPYKALHTLESRLPNGQWTSLLNCLPVHI